LRQTRVMHDAFRKKPSVLPEMQRGLPIDKGPVLLRLLAA
jgi:hypothetical protein